MRTFASETHYIFGGTKPNLARKNRFAPPGYWIHVTQRGINKQQIFFSDADRLHFLQLLETHSEERAVRIAAYSLMPNHYHLVLAGDRPQAVSLFMMDLNGLYSTYSNTKRQRTGPSWQGRFRSCVLDTAHWENALRYVELNAVRAHLVKQADLDAWSSARVHLGIDPAPPWLDTGQFQRHWPNPAAWRDRLASFTRREAAALRQATRHDSALGSDTFLQQLEQTYAVQLRPKPPTQIRKAPQSSTAECRTASKRTT